MAENVGATSSEDGSNIKLEQQERLLPIANVGSIMKQILPPNAKISKEAKETIQECVSKFISFVTSEASEKCLREGRKTFNGDDLCWAMTSLGFDEYAPPLRMYLKRYREMEGDRAGQDRLAGGAAEDQGEEPPEPSPSSLDFGVTDCRSNRYH